MFSYAFENLGRMDNDPADNTQINLANTRYAGHMLTNFAGPSTADMHLRFATQQPDIFPNGVANGFGLSSGGLIDADSMLLLGTQEERHFEKLQLFQRPFSTVPYLGRGFSNPLLESQLQQGEVIRGQKSVSTITEQSFMNYSLYPTDNTMKEHVSNTAYTVEESSNPNWTRGGKDTRITTDDLMWTQRK